MTFNCGRTQLACHAISLHYNVHGSFSMKPKATHCEQNISTKKKKKKKAFVSFLAVVMVVIDDDMDHISSFKTNLRLKLRPRCFLIRRSTFPQSGRIPQCLCSRHLPSFLESKKMCKICVYKSKREACPRQSLSQ